MFNQPERIKNFRFHPGKFPLLAACSDDATVSILHAKVTPGLGRSQGSNERCDMSDMSDMWFTVCLNIRWTWKSAGKSPGEWNVGIFPKKMAFSRGIPWYIIRYIPFSDRAMWCLVDGRLNMRNHQRLCDHMWSARGSSGCLRDGLRDGSHMKKYRLFEGLAG